MRDPSVFIAPKSQGLVGQDPFSLAILKLYLTMECYFYKRHFSSALQRLKVKTGFGLLSLLGPQGRQGGALPSVRGVSQGIPTSSEGYAA